MTPKLFKLKLKVKYISELGMYRIIGESLTIRTLINYVFYDKSVANQTKVNLDNADEYFYHNILKEDNN